MKISNTFPVLRQANALFVVSGKQSALLYRVLRGEIREREAVRIEKPVYTDREGFFESRAPGHPFLISGSVYEAKDLYMHQKFIARLVEEIKKVRHADSVYLFAPAQIVGDLRDALPRLFQEKVALICTGNFLYMHPVELLKKVKAFREEQEERQKEAIASEEAKKLLERSEVLTT